MSRSLAAALVLVLAAPATVSPATSGDSDRTLPMQFALRREGPAQICGDKCRLFVSASGAITADTPRHFELFARGRDLTGATVVLDSDGGSVHGAIALGRRIRGLGLDTTVGRLIDLDDSDRAPPRAKFSPRADCESMCAFLVLAGVHRSVPAEARVMVHQIWLGDRREDPTAASYSAEDLVLVQRDIGKLAQYTTEMGASIELLDIALRIPPWEPMHRLTRDEIDRTRLATVDAVDTPAAAAVTASARPAAAGALPRMTDGARASAISEQRWAMVERQGTAVLARRHPLTLAGEDIGSFDLLVACAAAGDGYDVSYIEHRRGGREVALPERLRGVSIASGGEMAALKVVSSQRQDRPDELVTQAAATVPAALIRRFAAVGNHSLTVTTDAGAVRTSIRLGNTGAGEGLSRLAAACGRVPGERASSPRRHGGALASTK
jgi:hypothetical protein